VPERRGIPNPRQRCCINDNGTSSHVPQPRLNTTAFILIARYQSRIRPTLDDVDLKLLPVFHICPQRTRQHASDVVVIGWQEYPMNTQRSAARKSAQLVDTRGRDTKLKRTKSALRISKQHILPTLRFGRVTQLIQIVRPCLHHATADRKERRLVIGTLYVATDVM